MLDLEEVLFRARALAQTHPFSPRAYRYVTDTVARERLEQPVPELGIWAGYAMNYGYCLRRVEEDDAGRMLEESPEFLPDDLDEAATRIAAAIRTEGAEPFLLYPEELVVAALDRLIAGEVERRLSHWEDTIEQETWEEIEQYIAWWLIKGYALRVAERLVPEEASAGADPAP